MSVSKLTKSAFLALAATMAVAFALGLLGYSLAMIVPALLAAASLVYLFYVVFKKALAPVVTLCSAMNNIHEKGLLAPGTPLEAPEGELGELAACCNRLYDELKELRAARDEIVASMPAPAVTLDNEWVVSSINPAATALGVPHSLKNRPFAAILDEQSKRTLKEIIEKVKAGSGAKDVELEVRLEGGQNAALLFNAVPLKRDGEPGGALLMGTDPGQNSRLSEELSAVKTESKEVEEKLNRTIRDLEEFALMAVRREIKMKEIREKLTELREGRGVGE